MPDPVGIALSFYVALFRREDDRYIADCPVLNQVSSGSSPERAIRNLKEETEFLFAVCAEDGSLDDVLKHRLSLGRSLPPSSPSVRIEKVYIDVPREVPFDLLRRFSDAAASAA